MAIINITSGSASTTIEGSTSNGSGLVSSQINGITYINEDLTKQVLAGKYDYKTTYPFLSSSIEIFVNGLRVSSEFDFVEHTTLDGFDFIVYDGNFNKWMSETTTIFVKYIKSS